MKSVRHIIPAGQGILDQNVQRALVGKAQQGDQSARNELIVHSLPLVLNLAKKILGPRSQLRLELGDLVDEGVFGLIEAIERFRLHDFSNQFTTYATFWVRKHMLAACASDQSVISVPEYLVNHLSRGANQPPLKKRVSAASAEKGRRAIGCRFLDKMDLLAQACDRRLYLAGDGHRDVDT